MLDIRTTIHFGKKPQWLISLTHLHMNKLVTITNHFHLPHTSIPKASNTIIMVVSILNKNPINTHPRKNTFNCYLGGTSFKKEQ